jgi:hypothetical protein
MTEKPPPALDAAPEKQEVKPAFLEQLTNQALADKTPENGGTEDKRKAVRCESTALYGVCQARTTTSSSLYAYPPPWLPETGQTAVENAGRALRALLWGGQSNG